MGPGSFDPGNAEKRDLHAYGAWRFNGAGVFRPRKFGLGEAVLHRVSLLQWGRGLSTPEMMPPAITSTSPRHASMGPGSFDPGNASWDAATRTLSVLQWGRGLSTPEIARLPPRFDLGVRRFNGAGVFRPRKCGLKVDAAPIIMKLQWGRGLSTPEMRFLRKVLEPSPKGFNGAGVFRPRKCAVDAVDGRAHAASMGPGSFDPGNYWGRINPELGKLASMGPGSFDPGNEWSARRNRRREAASMGPGSFDPGNSSPPSRLPSKRGASMGPGSFDPGNLPGAPAPG